MSAEELLSTFPKYRAWERGELHPTLRQLEKFATKTQTPLGYFFLPEPPDEKLPIPDFRTSSDEGTKHPSPNLLDTIQAMQRRQEWMREFLLEQGADTLTFVASATLGDAPDKTVGKIRATLGLRDDWARRVPTWEDAQRSLCREIENSGVMVVINGIVGNSTRRKLDVDEFRGFALCDEYAPLIFVNNADAKSAQMFTLVHELAHLWLGQGGVSNLDRLGPAENDVEVFCNQVAAEFLVPQNQLRACWTEAQQADEPFQFGARRFKVSPIVVARRALDLELIRREEFFAFYDAYQGDERRKKSKSKGGDFYANQGGRVGRRFAEAVVYAAKEGRLLYRDAYQLTGLYGATFDRYAKHIGSDL